MAGYGVFAQVYDKLTLNVPYDQIAEYYDAKIRKFRDGDGNFLADAGCGTGNLTARLARLGYDVIGAEPSPDMLSEAMNKPHDGVQYICQDMTELDLYGEADIIVSTLDSVNHLSSAADITKFFRAAALNLRRGGLLLFDFNTIYKHEKVLADNVFVYDLDDVYCVWQNEFNPEDKGVDITMPSEQVEKLLSESGFEVLEVREYLTNREPGAQSDKLMFCARKK